MDKSGHVDSKEILALVNTDEAADENVKKDAEELVMQLDKDNDGKVSREEWVQAFGDFYDILT